MSVALPVKRGRTEPGLHIHSSAYPLPGAHPDPGAFGASCVAVVSGSTSGAARERGTPGLVTRPLRPLLGEMFAPGLGLEGAAHHLEQGVHLGEIAPVRGVDGL